MAAVASAEAVHDIPYFSGLNAQELEAVRAQVGVKTYDKGELIFIESEPCRAVFFVRSGRIKIYKTSNEGREQVLRMMKRGDTFNEVPVFDGGPNPASAEAIERSTVLFVRKDDLLEIVKKYPVVATTVLGHFAGMMRHLTMLVEDLSFRHVTSRLAKVLLQHAAELNDGGSPDKGGARLTQQELASIVGTAREVVGRSLRSMEASGALRIEGHRIFIVKRSVLEEMV